MLCTACVSLPLPGPAWRSLLTAHRGIAGPASAPLCAQHGGSRAGIPWAPQPHLNPFGHPTAVLLVCVLPCSARLGAQGVAVLPLLCCVRLKVRWWVGWLVLFLQCITLMLSSHLLPAGCQEAVPPVQHHHIPRRPSAHLLMKDAAGGRLSAQLSAPTGRGTTRKKGKRNKQTNKQKDVLKT